MTRDEKRDQLWDYLLEWNHATEKELQLASHMNGFTLETMEMVLNIRTGYQDLEQIMECE